MLGTLLLLLALALVLVRGNSLPGAGDANAGPTATGDELAQSGDTLAIGEDGTATAVDTADDAAPDNDGLQAGEPVTIPAEPLGPFVEPSITISDGEVTLAGSQPTQTIADQYAAAVAAIVGADNVVNGYVVDARADEAGQLGAVTINETLTYVDTSVRLTDESRELLDLVVYTLEQNPDATLTISGHTVRSEQELFSVAASQAQADRLVVDLEDRGIDQSRIIAIGFGSSRPVSGAAPDAPINYRTELSVN